MSNNSGSNDTVATTFCYTEIFKQECPKYMSMGMTYDQFWNCDVWMAEAYRKAFEIKRRQENEAMWLQGAYTLKALQTAISQSFGKQVIEYGEPLPLTQEEQDIRTMNKIKQMIMKKGGQANG